MARKDKIKVRYIPVDGEAPPGFLTFDGSENAKKWSDMTESEKAEAYKKLVEWMNSGYYPPSGCWYCKGTCTCGRGDDDETTTQS